MQKTLRLKNDFSEAEEQIRMFLMEIGGWIPQISEKTKVSIKDDGPEEDRHHFAQYEKEITIEFPFWKWFSYRRFLREQSFFVAQATSKPPDAKRNQ